MDRDNYISLRPDSSIEGEEESCLIDSDRARLRYYTNDSRFD